MYALKIICLLSMIKKLFAYYIFQKSIYIDFGKNLNLKDNMDQVFLEEKANM
jgi:hypothetical protein